MHYPGLDLGLGKKITCKKLSGHHWDNWRKSELKLDYVKISYFDSNIVIKENVILRQIPKYFRVKE